MSIYRGNISDHDDNILILNNVNFFAKNWYGNYHYNLRTHTFSSFVDFFLLSCSYNVIFFRWVNIQNFSYSSSPVILKVFSPLLSAVLLHWHRINIFINDYHWRVETNLRVPAIFQHLIIPFRVITRVALWHIKGRSDDTTSGFVRLMFCWKLPSGLPRLAWLMGAISLVKCLLTWDSLWLVRRVFLLAYRESRMEWIIINHGKYTHAWLRMRNHIFSPVRYIPNPI